MAQIPVDFGVLMLNHPSYKKIRELVDGIPEDWETCCIQMSYALNKAGALVKNRKGNVAFIQGGQNYMSLVSTMRGYLNDEFGEAENYVRESKMARIAIISQITDRQGIIGFGDRHIDLWDRNNIHRPSYYILSALWEAPSVYKVGISFWEVGA